MHLQWQCVFALCLLSVFRIYSVYYLHWQCMFARCAANASDTLCLVYTVSVYYTVYSIQCILYSVQYTVYRAQCIVSVCAETTKLE